MAVVKEGVDFAWGRPSISGLKSLNKKFVCRYHCYLPNGKALTPAEASRYRANDLDIVSNWEAYGDWAHDYSGGYAKGRAHAQVAAPQALADGAGKDDPVLFSTDFNPTSAQLAAIGQYYRGVASVVGLERTGAYGGLRTIQYLFDNHLITYGWQTYAWSGGRWDPRAQLRQYLNGVTVAGGSCDLNRTYFDNFGQWGGIALTGGHPTPAPGPVIPIYEDAIFLEEEVIQVAPGPAADSKGNVTDKSKVQILCIDTGPGKVSHISLASDFGDARVRVAQKWEGHGGWVVNVVDVTEAGDRLHVAQSPQGVGGKVSIVRMPKDDNDKCDTPLASTVRIV